MKINVDISNDINSGDIQMEANEMEFIDEIVTQLTEERFGEYYNNTGFDNVKDRTYTLTDEAQDFYNERYDEIENLYINLILQIPKKL